MINRNFKLVWIGKLISQFGDELYGIALAWWVLQKTGSTVSMGLFMFASAAPGIIMGLFTGAISDRWNRKHIMVFSDAVRGILVLTISILAYTDMLAIWQVYAIGICLSAAGAFFNPSSQAILPDIVGKENLAKANSMSQMIGGVCTTLGPMLGALIVSFLGTNLVFMMNGVSFFVAMILAALMKYEVPYQKKEKTEGNIIRDIGEGLRYIGKRKNLLKILTVIGAAHFFVGSLSVSLPFLANGLSGTGVNNLGLLQMMLGIGLLAGSIYRRWRKNDSPEKIMEKGLMRLMLCYGMCFVVISGASYFNITFVSGYLPIFFLIGTVIANASVFWQLLLQTNTPSDMRGRVFGTSSLIGEASMPIAYGVIGIVLKYTGIAPVMLFSGVALMLISVVFMKETKLPVINEINS
jgi:MFS family permease